MQTNQGYSKTQSSKPKQAWQGKQWNKANKPQRGKDR